MQEPIPRLAPLTQQPRSPGAPTTLGCLPTRLGPSHPPQTQLCLIVIQTAQGRECVNSSCFILSLPSLRET